MGVARAAIVPTAVEGAQTAFLTGAERGTYCAAVDENFQNLMQELGEAINDAVLDSEGVDAALAKVRGSGIDVFLVLEATICVRRKDGEPVRFRRSRNRNESGFERPNLLREQIDAPAGTKCNDVESLLQPFEHAKGVTADGTGRPDDGDGGRRG